MTAATILTMANGKGIDLLRVNSADIDFKTLSEHMAKEKRFNGATPDVEYCVAQHCVIGTEAILRDGGTEREAAYFLLHDAGEALWKDDPTPKKCAIAERIEQRCGVLAQDILDVLAEIQDEHDAAIHFAAGLPWPMTDEEARIVKLYDKILFVTEWRDLMGGIEHPHWAPYEGVVALDATIKPASWVWSQIRWMELARRLLPRLRLGEVA